MCLTHTGIRTLRQEGEHLKSFLFQRDFTNKKHQSFYFKGCDSKFEVKFIYFNNCY